MKNYSQQEFLKTVTQKKPPNPTCNVVITNQTFDKIIGNCTHLFLRTFGKNWKLSFSIKQNLFAKYLVTSTQMKPTSNFNKANELYKSLPSFCLKMKHKKKIVFWGFPIIFLRRKNRQKKNFWRQKILLLRKQCRQFSTLYSLELTWIVSFHIFAQ